MPDTFFTFDADDAAVYRPTEHCRGPWNPDACHAGPPSGLIARAAESTVPDKRLTRLTLDLMRPIPMAGFRIESSVTRAGRAVAASTHSLVDLGGRECVRASALHLRTIDGCEELTDGVRTPRLADARPGSFPISRLPHGQRGFSGDGIAVRYPPGQGPEIGPTAMWMWTVPLLPDEEPSPFQRICPLADCANALSRHADPPDVAFVNADLTIMLHRDPVGDWLGMDATSNWHADGTGVADAVLFDDAGTVGRAIQALLLTPGA